jgi:integrase
VQQFPGLTLVTNGFGSSVGPWIVERAVARVRDDLGMEKLHFYCLRHYLATLLIKSGCDVKTVQARMRHGSAKVTLDTYGHVWESNDEQPGPPSLLRWGTGLHHRMFLRAHCGP